MSVEGMLDLNVEQTSGIFEVPPIIDEDPGLRIWMGRVRRRRDNTSRVIAEETYYKRGIAKKLKVSVPSIERLISYGMIRPKNSHYFSRNMREPACNLSIVQTTSWIHQIPMEDFHFTKKALKK